MNSFLAYEFNKNRLLSKRLMVKGIGEVAIDNIDNKHN